MKVLSSSEEETKLIGLKVGSRLKRGDVVCLYGELGSGKTTMVKGIARAFDIDERDITSASFVIVAEHEGSIPFYHIDLYRLTPEHAGHLGLEEYVGRDGVAVIEWAERADREIPDERIRVRLRFKDENTREIEIEGLDH